MRAWLCVCAKILPENSLFAFLKVFLHYFFAGLATRKYQTIRIHTYAQFSLRLSTPEPDTDVNVYLCVSVCPEMIMCVGFFSCHLFIFLGAFGVLFVVVAE